MRVAAVQMNSQDDKEGNLARAERLIEEAARKGAEVVVLPEMFNFLGPDEQQLSNAEGIPGPTIQRMIAQSTQHGIYLLCGSILEKTDEDNKVFNTSVLLSPHGDVIATYRKLHLFDVEIGGGPIYRESAIVKPGSEIVTAETTLAKFGLSICYDLRFPELYRRLGIMGAQVVFIPAAFTLYTGKDHWEPLLRARAIENQIYVIASAQIGSHPPDKQCYGKSMIVDPWGIVTAQASDKEMIIYSDLDLTYQEKVRTEMPSLAHRREDVFAF